MLCFAIWSKINYIWFLSILLIIYFNNQNLNKGKNQGESNNNNNDNIIAT